MKTNVIAVLLFLSADELAFLFLAIIVCLLVPALMGIACTTNHCLFKREELVEHEYDKKARELYELRLKHEARVRAQPQDEEELGQLFNQARQEIIDRPKPDEPKPVRSSSYD